MEGDRIRKWATKIGTNTLEVIDRLLKSKKVEQQMFKSCVNILKLGDKFTNERLEKACCVALNFTSLPNYISIKSILETNPETKEEVVNSDIEGALVRGSEYYGGKKDD